MSEGYQLVVAFPDESPSFARGFEAGKLWEEMDVWDLVGHGLIEATTMTENREVIRRMAVARGWEVDVTPTETEGWDYTVLNKLGGQPVTPNPQGFRIIKGGIDGNDHDPK